MTDIRIIPASGIISITGSANFTGDNNTSILFISASNEVGINTVLPEAQLHVSGTADVFLVEGSGSSSNTTLMAVDGANGRLFEVSDDLSGTLFSVNTIAGLPVIEAFADYSVVLGEYNQNVLVVTGSNVGIGTATPNYSLDVSGSGNFTNGLTVTGSLIASSFTGSLEGTASFAVTASYAYSASYEIVKEVSSSFADTASYVNTLNQDVIISGSSTSQILLFSQTTPGITIPNYYNAVLAGPIGITGSMVVGSGSYLIIL